MFNEHVIAIMAGFGCGDPGHQVLISLCLLTLFSRLLVTDLILMVFDGDRWPQSSKVLSARNFFVCWQSLSILSGMRYVAASAY